MNDLSHRYVYDIECNHVEDVRVFAIYNKQEQHFITTHNGDLHVYNVDTVVVVEELNLVVPSDIPLDKILVECVRHCRKLTHDGVQAQGGKGYIHYDDKMPCNEKVKKQENVMLKDFLTFLNKIG